MDSLIHHMVLACVTISEDETTEVLSHNFNVLKITGQSAILIYENEQYQILLPQSIELNAGDVVMISNTGRIHVLYSFASSSQTLFLTARCNSNCIMCPYTSTYRQNADIYSAELLSDMVRYLPRHTQHLIVTGGEPTLIGQQFFALMQMVKDQFPNIICLLLTNGRSMSIPEIIAKAIEHLPRYTTAAIPLHAASSELHDNITRSPSSFRQTLAGIHNLLRTSIQVEIRIVVFKQNLNEMLPLARLICNLPKRVHVVHFMAAEMCGNAAVNSEQIWVDYPKAFAACEAAIHLLIMNGIDVELYNFPLCAVPHKYWALYRKSISDYKIRYGVRCGLCINRSICGGVFASSLKLAEDGMVPIIGEPHENELF